MNEQLGWRGLLHHLKKEGPQWTAMMPQLPRLVHRALEGDPSARLTAIEEAVNRLNRTQRLQSTLLLCLVMMSAIVAGLYIFLLLYFPVNFLPWALPPRAVPDKIRSNYPMPGRPRIGADPLPFPALREPACSSRSF